MAGFESQTSGSEATALPTETHHCPRHRFCYLYKEKSLSILKQWALKSKLQDWDENTFAYNNIYDPAILLYWNQI